jgi:hypothetical protein
MSILLPPPDDWRIIEGTVQVLDSIPTGNGQPYDRANANAAELMNLQNVLAHT